MTAYDIANKRNRHRTNEDESGVDVPVQTAGQTTGQPIGPRRRPADRKAQILRQAAEYFSRLGYHQVAIADIADAVGISGPALYRHFPNKYALFRAVVFELLDDLAAIGEPAAAVTRGSGPDAAPADPAVTSGPETLQAMLEAGVRTSLRNRSTGGLYRWEDRYLEPEDRAAVHRVQGRLLHRIATEIARQRPELDPSSAKLLAAGTLSVIGSITAHRTTLGERRLEQVLLDTANRVIAADISPAPVPASPADAGAERREPEAVVPPPVPGLIPQSRREALLTEATRLFV